MNTEQKKQVLNQIEEYLDKKGMSQNKLARQIGISPGHMSNIRNDESWKRVSDETWNKVWSFFRPKDERWPIFTTPNYKLVHHVCDDARINKRFMGIHGETGYGKTTALQQYEKGNPNTYYILCNFLMSKKSFLRAIMRSMGLNGGYTSEAMLTEIVDHLTTTDNPLLILDDAGKLNDSCFRLIQLIYDATESTAGMVIAGTGYIKKHIDRSAERDKMGYRELQRRVEYWQELQKMDYLQVVSICEMNGVSGKDETKYVWRTCKNLGDIKNLITNAKRLANGNGVDIEVLSKVNVK